MRLRALLLTVPALAVLGIALLLVPARGHSAPALAGTLLPDRASPPFALTDQHGRRLTLSQMRGSPVIITFLQSHCTGQCPLVAAKIDGAVRRVTRAGGHVHVVAISMDPEGDTAASARAFLRRVGLLASWHFLRGSRAQLSAVWSAYHVYAPPPGSHGLDLHTTATYLLDSRLHQRVLIAGDPGAVDLVRDLRLLNGLPLDQSLLELVAPVPGHPAPDFALPALDGGTIALRSLRGRTVVINVFATWCGPCRQELPLLQRWYAERDPGKVTVVGVDRGEPRGDVIRFVRERGVRYPVLLDRSAEVASRYDVLGLPETFVVGPDGRVVTVHLGPLAPSFARYVPQRATG